MIKPASSICNLRCRYCFYLDTASHRECSSYGIMTTDVSDVLIEKILAYSCGGAVEFCFQGGEPLMAGAAFFQHFADTVEKMNRNNCQVSYAIQTNGTLLNEEFCALFQKHRFLVGVSLDGQSEVHNWYRPTADGKGSFQQVMRGIGLLQRHSIEFNILSVITKRMAHNAYGVFQFFKKHGFHYLQFTTCIEPKEMVPFSSGFLPNCDEYYQFHRELFDLYLKERKSGHFISIRSFDNLLAMLRGYPPEQCGMLGYCPGHLVIEADGSVFPCDFYCEDSCLLGNIRMNTVEELQHSPAMQSFQQASLLIDPACKICQFAWLCRGGCRRERDYLVSDRPQRNIYCEGKKKFFQHVLHSI